MKYVLALEEQPGPDDRAVIEQGLVSHAIGHGIEPRNHRSLTILVRDGPGESAGRPDRHNGVGMATGRATMG